MSRPRRSVIGAGQYIGTAACRLLVLLLRRLVFRSSPQSLARNRCTARGSAWIQLLM